MDVVIPTHNGWELTRSCLEHLASQTRPHTVIVADNASTDGTPESARSAFLDIRIVELAGNRGFSVACNHGVRAGTGDVVVLLNNDVDCPPEFIERLVEPLEADARIGSTASILVQPDGVTIDSVGLTADRTLAGFPRLRSKSVADARLVEPVLTGPAGAAGAYRRTAWDQVGGLDEGVFMYGEDVDLALRLRTQGWGTTLAADAVAVHRGSASVGLGSGRQRYHSGFARAYFLRRYGVTRSGAAFRTLATEGIVVAGDAVLSRDLAASRGRLAGWRSAAGAPRHKLPPREAVAETITLRESLSLRRRIYSG